VDVAMAAFSALIVTSEPYEQLRQSVLWLLGGPMGQDMIKRAPTEPGLLHTLSRAQAGRALWGGEQFWAAYRARFAAEPPGTLRRWITYFKDPALQGGLLMLPRH